MMMGSTKRSLSVVSALFFLCLLNESYWHAAATTNPSDLSALKALYAVWSNSYNTLPPDWIGDDPCGSSAVGIVCDNTASFVTGLLLQGKNLTGGIPSQIGDLTSLTSLDLSYNSQLGGPLPPELGKLTSLQMMYLSYCGLTGGIPTQLAQLVNLKQIALNGNMMSGTIPAEMGNLKMLDWFDISENSFSGSLPISTSNSVGLDNLTNCQHFHFYNNSLSGNIPPELFNLPTLVHMLLYSNNFTGSLPPNATYSTAASLAILRVDNNLLDGSLPQGLNQLTTLSQLNLGNNSFTGTLPTLTSLTELELLDVSHNLFDNQTIPLWVYSLKLAQSIVMDSANLIGTLNSSLFSLPNISTVSLSSNALNGTVDVSSHSASLQTINLQDNQFFGVNLASVNFNLLLAGNPICAVGNQAYCTRPANPVAPTPLWQPQPNPSCLKGVCSGSEVFNPNSCSCADPLVCIMQLTSPPFQSVDESLISTIQNEWALLLNLDPKQVYIDYAQITNDGRMSYNMSIFPTPGDSLNSSQVENITNSLGHTLHHTNEGPSLLINFVSPLLGGHSKGSKIAIGVIIGIVAAAILALIIFAFIAAYAIRQKKRADKAETSRPFASWGAMTKDHGEAPQLKGARWFSLAELRKATDNWSDNNEIGAGGYGKVYRAELPDGAVVAVKRADEDSVQGAVEFKTEIELLSRVHHRNLVGLVGFCYEGGEQALVYEYMPNGTLRDHLLGHFEFPLTWDARVAIALGSARGLTYLHELANPPIIHRDIKSGNILLDEKMVAKVADFGLSKLAPENADQKGHLSTQVKGTLGYLDPEYYMTNQLSEKSDVYSFGVVLLEMLSGRPPIERGKYIVREVRTALDKGGIKALEPLLDPFLGDYPPKQMEAFLDLALLCVDEVAAGRPTMDVVVKKLEVIAGSSQPNSDVHITYESQKADDIYGKDYLPKSSDPSFEYSGVSFTRGANVEPK